MATYFHGSSDIQGDGLQTLYLMNPNYVAQFSDTQQQQQPSAANNMLLLNSAGNALNLSNLSHAPPPNQTQHFVGIPLSPAAIGSPNSDDSNRPSWHAHHDIPAAQLHGIIPRFHYNLWGSSIDQSAPTGIHPNVATASATGNSSSASDVRSQLGFLRPAVSPTQQGNLSLSLSPQQPSYNRSSSFHAEHDIPTPAISPPPSGGGGEDMRVVPSGGYSSTTMSNGISGMQSFIFGSKYLKAAQQLLDEVVNVGKGIKIDSVEGSTKEKIKMNRESTAVTEEGSSGADQSSTKHGAHELTTAQRQELQMKKAKLASMFDEVEQRYRQYHHQMQVVITSFEQAAGFGSAKSYTALALKTISKQFRCLKDAISAQIKATSKSLGEEDCLGVKVEGSRLRLVDHQLRQQRALQQLGMIQHNAWRPQRGLPERAVSVLRAWLFEHFLHPYPKDSDKHMLAKQTGLTRSQVSNWFINARVRLWKPMVEEMYLEEIKDRELQNGSNDNSTKSETNKDAGSKSSAQKDSSQIGILLDQAKSLQSNKQEKPSNYQQTSPTEISNSTMSTSPMGGSLQAQSGFNLASSSDLEGIIVHRSPKKPRSSDFQNSPSSILSMDMDMKPSDTNREISMKFSNNERQTRDGYSYMNNGSGFDGAYNSVGEMGRFDPTEQLTPRFHGSGVSLTLGLPHCENLSLSGTQQNYLSNQNIQLGRRLKMGTGEPDFLWY